MIPPFAALALILLQACFQTASAEGPSATATKGAESYVLRQRQVLKGSVGNDVLAVSPYPLKKRFEDFTAEEKQAFRSYYEGMLDDDEPPFPERGMQEIMAQVSRMISEYGVQGRLTLFVTVGSDGRAESFSVLESPSEEAAKVVAFMFLKTRFKPALCGGKACIGEFPFRVVLKLSG